MKLIILILATFVLFDESSAFFARPFGPFMGGPFFGGGLLGGPFGLLGGLGLGSFGPFAGLGTGIARFGGIRGRRSVEDHKISHGPINCTLSTDLLSCVGLYEIIECRLESHVQGEFKPSEELQRAQLVFDDNLINGTPILKIVSKKSLSSELTNELERFSVYESESLVKTEGGFQALDPVCFSDIYTYVQQLPDLVNVKFDSLN